MKRILIVDDIEENLYLLRALLEGHNYEVDEARNGSEAIINAQKVIPDLIISDILMPVIDGYTLCRIWKADARFSRIPFIFYTATYTDPRDEKLAIDMGADAFIIKPTEPDEFMRRVEEILTLDKEGRFTAPQKPKAGNEHILKNYSEALIRKLEQKMFELEKMNKELKAEITERNLIETSLRESEELFRNLFHQHAAVKLIIDPDSGNIVDANEAAVNFYGWKRDLLMNMKIQDINTLSPEEIRSAMDTVRKQLKTSFEFRHRRADGSVRDVEVFSSIIKLKGKDFLHSVIHDITDRKQAEESLKENERQLSTIYDTVSDIIFQVAVEPDEKYRFISVNRAFCNVTGMTAEMVEGKLVDDIIPEPSLSLVLEKYRQSIKQNSVVKWEETSNYPSGQLMGDVSVAPVINEKGICTHLVGSVHDITEQKRSEKIIRENERKYRIVADNTYDWEFWIDLHGQFVYCSPSCLRITGYEASSFMDDPDFLEKIIHPDDLMPFVMHKIKVRESAFPMGINFRIIRPDGSERWIGHVCQNILDENGISMGERGSNRDITEQILAEEALMESEERYRLIFQNSLDAFFLTVPDGSVLSANPAACRMFGRTEDEIIALGRDCLFAIPDSRLETAIRIRNEMGHFNGELTALRKDGTEFPVEISSLIFTDRSGRKRTSTIVKDITDRKRSEQLTKIRLELHEYSASHTIEEIAVKTLDELEVLTGSSIGFFHFMVPGEKTLSLQAWSTRTVREFCTAEGKGLHYNIEQAGVWVDCVRQRKTVIHNDYPSLPHRKGLPEGHAPVIRELVVPIFRSDTIVAILGIGNKPAVYNEIDAETVSYLSDVAWDIISRKQAEIHLQELYNNLEQIVKTRTRELEKVNKQLEAFSYTVSHDLRAPLRHITGFIDLFRTETGTGISDKALHYMDVIQNSARRMGQLIDDLLSFSRMQRAAMSRQVLNMDEITDEVLNNLSEEITKNGIFIKRTPLPAVKGDKAMLNIMLTNLISNAVKFTSKSEKRLVEIGYEPDKNIFFVRDTGVGFEMKYADKLFGVFHRLHSDKEFEGTGIGLATVKNIIERHDGSIRVESEPGKGACFYFSLPLAEK